MPTPQEKKNDAAMELVQEIAKGVIPLREIDGVKYRSDYQDYQFIFMDKTHCEIREKLVDVCMTSKDEEELMEAKKEIAYRIKLAVEFEEWEQ